MTKWLLGWSALLLLNCGAAGVAQAAEDHEANAPKEVEARVVVVAINNDETAPAAEVTTEMAVETTVEATANEPPAAAETTASNDTGSQPTHKQSMLVSINPEGVAEATVQCFCLDADANMLAGVTGPANEIRVFDRAGDLVRQIELAVAPEAINLAPDGTILVAGGGKILRLDGDGAELAQVDSPHVAALRANVEQIREEVVQQHKQQFETMPQVIDAYTRALDQLDEQLETFATQDAEARKTILEEIVNERIAQTQTGDAAEAKRAAAKIETLASSLQSNKKRSEMLQKNRGLYEQALADYKKRFGDGAKPDELSEEQIDELVESALQYKMAVASISATGDSVFIACRAPAGYAYDVWKLAPDLSEGECIVSGLSGCCGQMDVQACDTGVYVAENSRHRVCRYDEAGALVGSWGKSARTGVEGFGSCCNPMNLAFGPDGVVYTAEDTTGRIKRYSPDGQLLSVVGSADVVPGCKKVAIGVSDGGDRVYMLDVTRNHIAVLDRVLPDPTEPISGKADGSQTAGGGWLRLFGIGD